MPSTITAYRVFIASPGGLKEERKTFRETIEAYNQTEAIPRNVSFMPVGWEDTLGGVGRPQSLINDDVRMCDFFLLILWDRWGAPPDNEGRFSSGTEEELHVALESLWDNAAPMTEIVVFFKSVDLKQLADPGPQLTKVLQFRQTLEQNKEHLFHTFDTPQTFGRLLTRHLGVWTRTHEQSAPSILSSISFSKTDGKSQQAAPIDAPISGELQAAWALAKNGQRTQAESLFAQAIVEGNDPRAFLEFGRFLLDDGRSGQARVMFTKARTLAKEYGDKPLMADTLRSIAQDQFINGDLSATEKSYELALELDRSLGRADAIASDLFGLAEVRWSRGDLVGAEEVARAALKMHEEVKDLEGLAHGYRQLANVLTARGNFAEAETLFGKSLELCRQLGLKRRLIDVLTDYGYLFEYRGELERAEAHFSESLQIAEGLSVPIVTAHCYVDLGRVLAARDRHSDAENLYSRACVIYERLGWIGEVAKCKRALGLLLRNDGNLSEAEAKHLEALVQVMNVNLEETAITYHNLAEIAKDQNDIVRAREYREKALEIYQRLGKLPRRPGIRTRAHVLVHTFPE